ncbi:protein kinase [Nocardia sp. NPDC051756]|uniref:protein kinase domain-containing protein n=1 Tax=Nocardia sp. NPDC051756 TaxID=3154751 RepID=UPI00341481FD
MGATWFGHFRLDRSLGSGSTGQVWLAYNSIADRVVALKVLSATVAADSTYRQRFTREARLAAQVRGPHLAAIHTFGELDGRLYLELEHIEGSDLATVLRLEGPMPPARAVRVVMQVAQALDAAHRIGLVHRDVKPSNIMLGTDHLVRLIDFGTAYRIDQPAITTSSNVVGTLAYMAPERFSGSGDARSDQYSLACVLYECLTARRPFGDADAAQSLLAHLMTDPPLAAELNPAVPAALDAVIARGMAKVPEQRCLSAGEFASAAYAAVTGLDVPTVETAAVVLPTRPGSTLPFRVAESGPPIRTGDPGPRPAPHSAQARRRVAAGVLVALLGAMGVALWLDLPGDEGKGSAAAISMPTTSAESAPSAQPPPRAQTSDAVAPAPETAPVRAVPVAWQPCDPSVDGQGFAGDGTVLQCVGTGGRIANWMPAMPIAEKPKPNTPKPGRDDTGGGNNGNGHGKHGNDK